MVRLVEESEKAPKKVRLADDYTARAEPVAAAPTTPTPRASTGIGPGGMHTPISGNTLRKERDTGGHDVPVADSPQDFGGGGEGVSDLSSPGQSGEGYELTQRIMQLLQDTPVGEDSRREIRQLLDRHALRMRGVYTARDIVRTALKSKELSISHLQERIVALENERKADKERIRELGERVERLERNTQPGI